MLRRARVAKAALVFGSTVALGVLGVTGCSVNQTGLAIGGGGASGVASGGVAGTTAGAGGIDGVGSAGSLGGSGGSDATTATGGSGATGDAGVTGGSGATGDSEAGASGGSEAGATGGSGAAGSAGTDGLAGSGGIGGSGGGGPRGGSGGSGHVPDCSSFPSGSSVTLTIDNRLHCYWTHVEMLDWNSSESACVDEGGTLATILSLQENNFVLDLLTQTGLFEGLGVSLGGTDGKAHTDITGAGIYSWVTGEAWGYTHWQLGQPDGACTSCGAFGNCGCDHRLTMMNDGTWYARPETLARPFLCEALAH